jgi:hypothetical protein
MSNQPEIKELMSFFKDNKPISDFNDKLRGSKENKRIIEGVENNTLWNEDDKKKSLIASRYLNSVGKGENALELSYALEENLNKKESADYQEFVVPDYIQKAIEWISE